MTKYGHPYHGTKSDLLELFAPKEEHNNLYVPQKFDGLVVDLSVIIQALATVIDTSKFTYGQFADKILHHIEAFVMKLNTNNLDIVADMYHKHSIKATRGSEARVVYKESDKLPDHLSSFLKNDDNKRSFNSIISQHGRNPLFWSCNAEVVITKDFKFWSKSDGDRELVPWKEHVHEEADNRMIAHVMDMLKKEPNIRTICVQTADSDVIVSLTSYMATFKAESQALELWVNFGMGNSKGGFL